ncbi:hypothetical protein M434DRAFT_31242 [Hypoxylon sp. CO27-5]|nr:hypothetical protein M434DRAFT_31242 [Hypoxylon sp. CO27-5]
MDTAPHKWSHSNASSSLEQQAFSGPVQVDRRDLVICLPVQGDTSTALDDEQLDTGKSRSFRRDTGPSDECRKMADRKSRQNRNVTTKWLHCQGSSFERLIAGLAGNTPVCALQPRELGRVAVLAENYDAQTTAETQASFLKSDVTYQDHVALSLDPNVVTVKQDRQFSHLPS